MMGAGSAISGGLAIAGGIGDLIGSILGAGKKPRVPPFTPVSPTAEAGKAIQGNLANFGIASELASRVNALNAEELQKMLRANIPGYDALTKGSVDLITSKLKGELPADVSRAVKRNAAEASVAGGTGGSEFARNLSLRDLGLTSLAVTNEGLDSASRWLALSRQAFTPAQVDVTSMFVSPAQQIQTEMWNTEMKMGRDWLSNQIAAMPDPMKAAIGGSLQRTGQAMMGAGLGGLGGGGGGGGSTSAITPSSLSALSAIGGFIG